MFGLSRKKVALSPAPGDELGQNLVVRHQFRIGSSEWWELAMSSPADRTGGGSSRLGRSKNDERIKRVRILATVPVIILAGVLSGRGSDWTTWRADSARSGYTKDALPEKLALSWSWTPRHAPRSAWPRDDRMKFDRVNHVAVAGGMVFFGSSADGTVSALDAATGGTLGA